MVQAVLTWEADELRAGMRKIPGFAGHVTGLRHTMARTYGSATAEALNEGTECRQQFNSAVLGHRHDGFTTAAHPDFPFKDEIYRKRPDNYFAKVIPGYAGTRPGWSHVYGQTMGMYAGNTMVDFMMSTRGKSRTLRQKTAPAEIFALKDPMKPPPTVPLYLPGPAYIPSTSLYSRAARERFGASFTTLTRESFTNPVPRIPAPLQNNADGKNIEHLTVPSTYMGYKPRALPFLCRHLDEKRAQEQGRQRQIHAYKLQEQQQQQQQQQDEQDAYPEEMYDYLSRAQGDAQFSDAVQAAADAYRQERDTKGPASAMRVWEDHKAYIDMTFMPKLQSSLKARF